ncbi:MAG TPA: alpha/beta fold hydrolase, partial [Pirellulales bacterium]|nr:alpha/beta fold hydrolase [Pirellulales bacterium]
DDRYLFTCRAHHLLFDGWSLAILVAQVLEIYGALLIGRLLADRKLPGFRDYVAWLDKQDAAAAEAFWQAALAGIRSPTPIGFHRVTNVGDAENTYGSHLLQMAAEHAAALTAWLRQNQLTLSTAVHAAWAVLLARHSGRRDVVFGTTVSGRPAELPGVDSMVGPFINNVPLRVKLTGDLSVLSCLKQVQSALGELTTFQHTPLTDIERWSDLDRQARLFESLVVLENYPRASAELESLLGLRVIDLDMTATMVYPLSLLVLPDRLLLDLRFDRRRFTEEEAKALLRELADLLAGMPKVAHDPIEEVLAQAAASTHQPLPATDADAFWNQTSLSGAVADKHAAPSSEFVAPRDAIERTLAAVWSDLTGREKVGVRDNFFELGGDSLMAVRLMAEVERQFGRKLPLVWLFQDPTLERLADVLRSGDQPAVCLVPIRPRRAGSRPPLFCAHPAGGTVFCYRELARLLADDQPVYGLQARGIDGREPPRARLEEMAADYVAEIRKAQPVGPYWLLGWSLGGLIVFEMARQLAAAGQRTGL